MKPFEKCSILTETNSHYSDSSTPIDLTDIESLKNKVRNDLMYRNPIIRRMFDLYGREEINHEQFVYGMIVYLAESVDQLQRELIRTKMNYPVSDAYLDNLMKGGSL